MKISVNDIELFSLSETQKKIMQHIVSSDIFEEDMKRRLKWVLMHAYENWFEMLKKEWDPKLIELGIRAVPTDPEEYAQLVFAQPNYKDRKARDLESVRG
jgi:hypothetical protein